MIIVYKVYINWVVFFFPAISLFKTREGEKASDCAKERLQLGLRSPGDQWQIQNVGKGRGGYTVG